MEGGVRRISKREREETCSEIEGTQSWRGARRPNRADTARMESAGSHGTETWRRVRTRHTALCAEQVTDENVLHRKGHHSGLRGDPVRRESTVRAYT